MQRDNVIFDDKDSSGMFHSLMVNTISQDDLHERIIKLTPDQHQVFSVVKEHFESSSNQSLRLFVSGGAGTDKYFLIKKNVEWLRTFTSSFLGADPVLVCGLTGMSARNINGKTIHSALKLPVQHGREPAYKELSGKTLKEMRLRYRYVHTMIIDEISMVSSQTLKECTDYFGGLTILLIGDFYQLKPVRGQFAFCNELLWNLFHTYILETNMRQSSDNSFKNILDHIRLGQILGEDLAVLSTRLVCGDHVDFVGALRIFPTIAEVKVYNDIQQNSLNANALHVHARHTFTSKDIGDIEDISEYIPKDDRDVGGFPVIFFIYYWHQSYVDSKYCNRTRFGQWCFGFYSAHRICQ